MRSDSPPSPMQIHRGVQGDVAYYDEFPREHKLVIDIHHHYKMAEKNFVDILMRDMDAAGVHKVCLFSSSPQKYGDREEEDWKRFFKDYSDRVIGFGTINPGRIPQNKPELVDEYHSKGFKGIKFTTPTKRYDHGDFLIYYEKAEKYNMPVLFHTGVVARGSVEEREDVSSAHMRPVYLDRIARWCPKLRIVGAHMGEPWYGEAYNTSQKNPLLWLDISGKGLWLKAQAIREHLWIRLRPEKLVFGLDEPSSQYARTIHFWDTFFYEIGLNQTQRDMIFGETAAQILNID